LPDIPHIWRRWSPGTEASEVAEFDIGIMPMPDDQWARGKCAMKALIYMASGVPTICSDVGANRDVIRHGENGFLVRTAEDWINTVAALISDSSLRARVGMSGRHAVEDHYSTHVCGGKFARLVREIVNRSHRRQIGSSAKRRINALQSA
jgi:hypothetical protein